MDFFKRYIRDRRKVILVFGLFCMIFGFAFLLYHLPSGAVTYPALVCAVFAVLFFLADYKKAYEKHKKLKRMEELTGELIEGFPVADTWEEADYQRIVNHLREEKRELVDETDERMAEMMDYFTLWVHQIKTPIASMRLNLQNEDSALVGQLQDDLLYIEQYVEMVLCYLKLTGQSSDYVIREYDLDTMIRQAVKKYAGQFIRRRITLKYEPVCKKLVTDEKWLIFVIEQVLSNALKYTRSGFVAIYLEEDDTLCIKDTGIGIEPSDLPRIFEKGYTGCNGRADRRASGIGLYLCRRICTNLGHTICAESQVGQGTTIRIGLKQKPLCVE